MQGARKSWIAAGAALVAVLAILWWWHDPLPTELEGVWKVHWQQYNGVGKRVPRELWALYRGQWIIVKDDGVQRARLTASAARSPKQFDTSLPMMEHGIYVIHGDELRVCQVPAFVQDLTTPDLEEFEVGRVTVLRRVAGADAAAGDEQLRNLLIAQFGPPKVDPPPRQFDPTAQVFVDELMQRINGPGDKADDPASVVWNVSWLITEVDNGGFHQYLYNSSGDSSADTVRQLKQIGAVQTAAMVERARAQFPNGAAAEGLNQRRRQLEKLDVQQLAVLEDLDAQFYARSEDLCLMLKQFWEQSPRGRESPPSAAPQAAAPIAADPSPALWRRLTGKGLVAALAVLVLFGIWRALQPRWIATIVVEEGKVLSHQGIAQAQVSSMIRFFENDVVLTDHVTIRAARESEGGLRLDVKGLVDRFTQQQIRNFLLTVL